MSLHTDAGYTEAILSLSLNAQSLANREETIYGLLASVLRTFHGSQQRSRRVLDIDLGGRLVVQNDLRFCMRMSDYGERVRPEEFDRWIAENRARKG